MARVPIEARPALAQWLIRARGEMTQDAFLEALRAETGSAPNTATYRGWESGRLTPRASNIAPIVAFWERRGAPGPDAAPASSLSLSLDDRAVLAAERQAAAAERQTEALLAVIERMDRRITFLEELVAGSISPEELAAVSADEAAGQRMYDAHDATSRLRRSDPARPELQ